MYESSRLLLIQSIAYRVTYLKSIILSVILYSDSSYNNLLALFRSALIIYALDFLSLLL